MQHPWTAIASDGTLVRPATATRNYLEGIPHVVVNGVVTVDNGEFIDVRPGAVLRRGR
jgi:hypothetical protein